MNPLRCAIAALLLLAGSHHEVGAQSIGQTSSNLAVDDPRPVAAAVEELTERYGYSITYEDPRYAYDGDIRDAASEVRKDWNGTQGAKARVLIPVGGTLNVTYDVTSATGQPQNPEVVVQKLIDAQAVSSTGGAFRLERNDQFLHVVPARVRNSAGEWVDQRSVLAVPIDVPDAHRTALTMLDAICTAIGKASRDQIVLGTVPVTMLAKRSGIQGARNEMARDVLIRTLDRTGSELVWSVFYDPTMKQHVLNLRILQNKARPSKPLIADPRIKPARPQSPTTPMEKPASRDD